MSRKLIIIITVLALLLGVAMHQIFFKKNGEDLSLFEIKKTEITNEISETGVVKKEIEKTGLGFNNSGRIEEIFVKVGEQIKAGQELAKLETKEIQFQLREAEAALSGAKADYEKLIAGSTPEEIRVAEAEVEKARISLEGAKQNLEDVKEGAQEELDNALQSALTTLDDAYLELYDSYNLTSYLQRTYFASGGEQDSVEIKYKIKGYYEKLADLIDAAEETVSEEDIDSALSKAKEFLNKVSDYMQTLRDLSDSSAYVDRVTSSDKSSISSQKSSLNSAYSEVLDAVQNISTTKIANAADINTAQASVSSAEASLKKAEEELSLILAGARAEDLDLYKSKVIQAESKISQLRTKLEESSLKSSFAGQVSKIGKEEGELVQPQDTVVTVLPASPFQIKVDIYEEDIVEVKVGNPVEINLVAFPEETLKGEVSAIDPAEKIVEGVVYYETTIIFKETREGIKSGMTADVVIITAKKENVLAVPEDAVKEGLVQVFSDGKIEKREVELGMEGEELIEVISGLQEGEKAVIE